MSKFCDGTFIINYILAIEDSINDYQTLVNMINEYKEFIKLEDIINRLLKCNKILYFCLDYYRTQLRLTDFVLSSIIPVRVLNKYPEMFKVIDGHGILMNNLEKFRRDAISLVSGTTGREEYKLLDILAEYC